MKNYTKRMRPGAGRARPAALCLLALAAALLGAGEARAQWSTNDAAGNTATTGSGRVGIGIATPSKGKLHVSLEEGVTAGEHGMIYASRPDATGGVYMGYRANGTAVTGGYLRSTANLPLFVGTNGVPEAMAITNTGSVGIGTTAPAQALHVKGRGLFQNTGTASAFIMDRTDGKVASFGAGGVSSTFAYDDTGVFKIESNTRANIMGGVFGTGATTRLTIDGAGNVGIGAANPNYRLVVGPELPAGLLYATMTVSKGADASSSIVVGSGGASVAELGWDNANGRAILNAPGTTPIAVTQNGTNVRMYVNGEGNVGIGTNDPLTKLHVEGNVTVSGNITAKYQDVAEWVPSTQKLAVGTVVVVDSRAVNGVLASTSAYDTSVAGVISAQPGLLLGEGGEGKVMVATTGRVRVRVDATRGAIRAGDLLVSSGVAGVAMRSEPVAVGGVAMHRPGTLIGKALESLEKGTGEILVLLSLQ